MSGDGQGVQAVPAVWYDLAARIGSVQAVVSCIPETLDITMDGMTEWQASAINRAAALAGAVSDLLDLLSNDSDRLEAELNKRMGVST